MSMNRDWNIDLGHITISYFLDFTIPPVNYTWSPQDEHITDQDVNKHVI